MWDCIIVGGGPAGLTAATYLGRFRRRVMVIDAGESRVQRIPLTRNTPGFPDGIAGSELLKRMQDQAGRYGASFRHGRIEALSRSAVGFDLALAHEVLKGRNVLLATGAKLAEPVIADLDDGLAQGRIRYCPICDGFEAQDQRIAVLGGRAGAIEEAHFLRTYSDRITYYYEAAGAPNASECAAARAAGVAIASSPFEAAKLNGCIQMFSRDGALAEFDVLYPCLGCDPQSALALTLGAECSPAGGVLVDAHQRTNVSGFYAAGDVLQGLDQIASACGQGAVAAVAIHNALRAAGV